MKRLFILFMTVLFAFGIHEVRAGTPEQKSYVPDIVTVYDINLSNELDATIQESTFRDIVGEDIIILYDSNHAVLNSITVYVIQDDSRMESIFDKNLFMIFQVPEKINFKYRYIQKDDEYSMLGNSKRQLYRLAMTKRLATFKNYSQLGYSIKY
jgi:hypothetical protein